MILMPMKRIMGRMEKIFPHIFRLSKRCGTGGGPPDALYYIFNWNITRYIYIFLILCSYFYTFLKGGGYDDNDNREENNNKNNNMEIEMEDNDLEKEEFDNIVEDNWIYYW